MSITQAADPALHNPYAPPVIADTLSERDVLLEQRYPPDQVAAKHASVLWTLCRWPLVCFLAALPSLLLGLMIGAGPIRAMIMGILIFVAIYTMVDFQTRGCRWRASRITRRTLRIALVTRIVISILLPLGASLDEACGEISLQVTEVLTGEGLAAYQDNDGLSYWAMLVMTLVQGGLLTSMLAVYAAFIQAVQLMISAIRR